MVGVLLSALTGGLVRKPQPARPVAVPDVRGLFYPVCVEGMAAPPPNNQ